MAIPVVNIELRDGLVDIEDLGNASEAHVLACLDRTPLCRFRMRVTDGRIRAAEIWSAVGGMVSSSLVQRLLESAFPGRPTLKHALPACTVIVCTKDRPDDLQRCLNLLASAVCDTVEVLVVDNAPSDDRTRQVASCFPVSYCVQPRKGLNWARSMGVRVARNDIVLFTDDDVVVSCNWVDEMRRMFVDSSVGVVTGAVEPLELETEGQVLAERYAGFYRGFQIRSFNLVSYIPAGVGAVGAGASMAFRRQTAIDLALFDNELDAGTATLSGGDHYAMYSVVRAGYTLRFNPSALAWHRHRRTISELEKALYGYGSGSFCFLARSFLLHRDVDALLIGLRWCLYPVLLEAWRSWIGTRGSRPRNLAFSELRGLFDGPRRYLSSRQCERQQRFVCTQQS